MSWGGGGELSDGHFAPAFFDKLDTKQVPIQCAGRPGGHLEIRLHSSDD